MCKKLRVFFVVLLTTFFIAASGVFSVTSFADETSLPDDFVGPQNTTTTTEPVDYTESGPLGWIASKISDLGQTIVDGFSDLFVPDQDFLDDKFSKLKSKFSFWESIADTWQVFLNLLESTDFSEPPVVTVHISNYQGRYDFGDSATILDLSWYAPFKSAGDLMINAFIWLFFLWNLFRRLPDIISGSGMVIDRMSDVYVD